MRGRKDEGLRREAVRLRVEKRLTYSEIQMRLGQSLPKSTLSDWLSVHPLSEKEQFSARSAAHHKPRGRKRAKENPSKYYVAVSGQELSTDRRGRIAEAAVLFRLALHGLETYGRVSDGQSSDWVVRGSSGVLRTVQVRIARWDKCGEPVISLRCSDGRHCQKRLSNCDILIGYDLYRDTSYVFEMTELEHLKSFVTVREDAAERWDKI